MLEMHYSVYRELFQASAVDFARMISKPDYKAAVRSLVGDQIQIVDLGLCSNTISKLKRNGIDTIDALICFYEESWISSASYLSEVSYKLDEYVRSMLSMVIGEGAALPEQVREHHKEHDKPIEELELSTRSFKALKRSGIHTISQLLECTDEDIDKIRNLGAQSKLEIQETLQAFLEKADNAPVSDACFINHSLPEQVREYYKEHDKPIEKLELSTRALHALKRSGIHIISQLLDCTDEDINKMQYLGAKSKQEIRETLQAFLEKADNAPVSDACFINHSLPEQVREYYKEHDKPIEELELSTRSFNALKRSGIHTISQLLECTDEDIDKIRNLGAQSKLEIQETLQAFLKSEDFEAMQFDKQLNNTDEGIAVSDCDIQKMLLSMYNVGNEFYGYSFKEFREELPESVSDEEIKTAVSALLKKREIEYVDFRCYRIYPSFYDYLVSCDTIKDGPKEILMQRLQGLSLQQIADKQSVTRSCVQQKEAKALRVFRKCSAVRLFDEDYYRYLYENYAIPKEVWLNELGRSNSLLGYLSVFCEARGKGNPEDALEDPQVSVNLKYRLQKLFEKAMLIVNGEKIERHRLRFERAVLKHYCSDEVSFEEFIEIYNRELKYNKISEDHDFYFSDDNKRSRGNNLSSRSYVLWKQGERLRYYDADKYDFSELLEIINLSQFRNIEISANKFILEYPELMEKYDIRDEYELHRILKRIVDPNTCHEIVFSRQPMIRFGNFDRREAVLATITELSPVSSADLVAELQKRFGYSEEMIRANCIAEFSDLYHQGYYTVDFKKMSDDKQTIFLGTLTESFYTFDNLKTIYQEIFPTGDLQEVNPRMMKQLGFVVNGDYVIQHYKTAEEYITHVLTKDDILDLSLIRKRFEVCQNTFYPTLRKLCDDYEIFYFERDRLLHFRRLQKLGITKEMLRDFCDSAIDLISDAQFFTIYMLRKNGFTHPLDDLGLDDYFYNALLRVSPAVSAFNCFGSLVLCKVKQELSLSRVDFVASLLSGKISISIEEIKRIMQNEYGIQITKELYRLVEFTAVAAEKVGMYFDKTMEKVYKDRSYYFEDLERNEMEE